MPRFVARTFEQIFAQMLAQVVASSTLSDVADTSVVKHVLAAAATADDELYYQMTLLLKLFSIHTATKQDLDDRAAEIQPGTIRRYPAFAATGQVVFSRNGTLGAVSIPAGTKVKTGSGQVFTTTVSATITAASVEQIPGHGVGRDSAPTAIVADELGAAGNVASGTILKFDAKPAGVDEVTNPNATLNGEDKESDPAFRERLMAYIASLPRSVVLALETAVLGATDPDTGAQIRFSKAIEDEVNLGRTTVYIDDGTGGAEDQATVTGETVIAAAVGGEVRLRLDQWPLVDKTPANLAITSSIRGLLTVDTDYRINITNGRLIFTPALAAGEGITATYLHYVGLIQLAQKIIVGDENDRQNYPGYRAGGTWVQVLTPDVLVQNVTATVTPADGYNLADLEAPVVAAIKGYINALSISGDVLRAELYKRVQSVPGVANTLVVVPASDVVILDHQLARTQDSAIQVN